MSSEGILSLAHVFLTGDEFGDAVNFSLWLHGGTALSCMTALRGELWSLTRETVRNPLRPPVVARYLVFATLLSIPVGLLVFWQLHELTDLAGSLAMMVVGCMMLLTGAFLLVIGHRTPFRDPHELTWMDVLLMALTQGLAVIPGMSRSGLTVSVLLGRGVEREDAVRLSFLLGIPVSVGAMAYVALTGGVTVNALSLLGLGISALVGYLTIRGILRAVRRVSFAWFVIAVGGIMVASEVFVRAI